MSIKKLRNQLFAAIAMVLVASIALGSSTYAWFVSNNSVKATTANITAKSNAAFLQIGQTENYAGGETLTTFVQDGEHSLYPATVVENSTTYKFQTGYAASKGSAKINAAGLKDVEEVNIPKYALKQTVYINAQEGEFTRLTGTGIEVTGIGDINEAMRVLLVNRNDSTKYQVWAPASAEYAGQPAIDGKDNYTITNPTAGDDEAYATLIADGVTTKTKAEYTALPNQHTDAQDPQDAKAVSWKVIGGDVIANEVGTVAARKEVCVDMYVFYEGADRHVYTTNFVNLGSAKVTVNFNATQKIDA